LNSLRTRCRLLNYVKVHSSDCSVTVSAMNDCTQSIYSLRLPNVTGTTDCDGKHWDESVKLTVVVLFYPYRLPGVGSCSCRSMALPYVGYRG
jgi:hypothetical protein